jgi:pimeloyl-ACP methyl ester carboxylesterase
VVLDTAGAAELAPLRAGAAQITREHNGSVLHLADGRLLGFAEYGDPAGVPLMAFHGTPGSRFMFQLTDGAARQLGLRVIAPERPGFGLSTFQPGRTLRHWAADVAALADALEVARFAVAGISGGGPYAAACAAMLPERVTALGLISPVGPVAGPERPAKVGKGHLLTFRVLPRVPHFYRSLSRIGRIGFLYAPLAVFALMMTRVGAPDWRVLSRPDVRRNLLHGVAEGFRPGGHGIATELRIFSDPWNVPLSAIAAPSFLWQGTSDRNVPPASSFRLGELIPGCQVSRIEGAGHYWIFNHLFSVMETIAAAARKG